jgi:Leucine-rich repeat (LRR) protein
MELPTSISLLNAFQKFNLANYSQLEELPTTIGQLNAFQDFNLEGCSMLMDLPTSIGQSKDIVFKSIIKYSSLRDFGPYIVILFLYEDF